MLHYRPVRLWRRLISNGWPVRYRPVNRCGVVIVNHWPVRLARLINYFIVYSSVMVVYNGFIYNGCFINHRAININSVIINPCTRPAVIGNTVSANIGVRITLYICSARATNYSYVRIVVMHVINDGCFINDCYITAAVNIVVINLRAGYVTVRYKRPPVSGNVATE